MFIILVFFVSLMSGCVGMPGQPMAPPTPLEVKILSQTSMSLAILTGKLEPIQVQKLLPILGDVRGVLQLAIVEDPTNLEPISLGFLTKVDPVYRELVKGMVTIIIVRVRPYINQGDDGLKKASEYIDAVFDGAILACEQSIALKPAPT